MLGMDALMNEWGPRVFAPPGRRGSAYLWVLVFSLNVAVEQPGSSPASSLLDRFSRASQTLLLRPSAKSPRFPACTTSR
ncbi:hypothetical protein CN082_26190 [Sinorhizobium meliloti]|nr:hypothetical protein CN082_26190 [Sinorhizobium meliloti]